MPIIVSLTLATICFSYQNIEECHPVLIGKHGTPVGEFDLIKRITSDPGYGGDVLQFYENDQAVYAIHRVWTLRPREQRINRLKSANIKDRFITNGCINVDPIVYDRISECCSWDKLIIKE